MFLLNRKYKDVRAIVKLMTILIIGLAVLNLFLFYLLTTAKNHYNLQLDIFKQQIVHFQQRNLFAQQSKQMPIESIRAKNELLSISVDQRANEMQLHIFTTLGPVMSQRHYWALKSWSRLNNNNNNNNHGGTGACQVHIHIFTNLDTQWKESRQNFVSFVQSLGCATEHKLNEDGLTNDSNRLPYMNYLFHQAMDTVPPVYSTSTSSSSSSYSTYTTSGSSSGSNGNSESGGSSQENDSSSSSSSTFTSSTSGSSGGYDGQRDTTVFVYLNADIFVTESLFHSIRSVYLQKPEKMLLVARRWNLDQEFMLDSLSKLSTEEYDEQKVYNAVYKHGDLFMDRAIDLFAFNRNLFGSDPLNTIPPFIMAAPYWDNWMIQHAGAQKDCVAVDATNYVMIVHINHNSHRFASHMSTYLLKNFKTAKGYIWPLTNSGSTVSLPYEMFGSTQSVQCPCVSRR